MFNWDEDVIAMVMGGAPPSQAMSQAQALRGQPPQAPPMPQIGAAMPPPEPPPGFNPNPVQTQPPMPDLGMAPPPRGPGGPGVGGGALPRATGQQGPAADPLMDNYDRLQASQGELLARQMKAYQPIDPALYKGQAEERTKLGGQHLLMALAAQEAGKDFAPMQAQFLKQAGEYKAPKKVVGGELTESGFQADPGYAQELGIKRIEAKIAQNENKLAQNLTAQERTKTEEANRQLRIDLQNQSLAMQKAISDQGSADRRYAADLAHQDRVAANGGVPKTTDTERAASGFASRMEGAEATISKHPGVTPTMTQKYAAKIPLVGEEARSALESSPQQVLRTAQQDWVRAKLRKESGAAIPDAEMEREIVTNFPQPGDGPEAIAEKARIRQQAMLGMTTGAGRAHTPVLGGGNVPTVSSPAEAAKLPPGTRFRTPDGVERVRQ
jgi:hypothetical protein